MTTSTTPRFPDVHVRLSGLDGNVFAIMGRVGKALAQAGATQQELADFMAEVMSSGSYAEALAAVMRWVSVS
jgi:hypothetical protein